MDSGQRTVDNGQWTVNVSGFAGIIKRSAPKVPLEVRGFPQPPSLREVDSQLCCEDGRSSRTNALSQKPFGLLTALACGLGHAAALTAHRAVKHFRVAACGSLNEGASDMPSAAGNADLREMDKILRFAQNDKT